MAHMKVQRRASLRSRYMLRAGFSAVFTKMQRVGREEKKIKKIHALNIPVVLLSFIYIHEPFPNL